MLNSDQFGENPPKRPPPYAAHTEMVPVSAMSGIPGNRLRYDPSELTEDIRQNGIREPLLLAYSQKSRTVVLGEGNHRLEAARRLGMEHVPVRAVRYNMEGPGKPVRGIDPDESGYVPGDLRPSQIMDYEKESE